MMPINLSKEAHRKLAEREEWEMQCIALGATLEQTRAYDASAIAYAQTTLYLNSDVAARLRRLALEALKRGEGFPTCFFERG